jgi:6-phosphogluconolactonase
MLACAPVPPDIHPIPTEGLTPGEAALSYERAEALLRHGDPSPDRPLFDITFLGLGLEDISPRYSPARQSGERTRWWRGGRRCPELRIGSLSRARE